MVPHFNNPFFWILALIVTLFWAPKVFSRTFTSLDDRKLLEYYGEQKLRLHTDKISPDSQITDEMPLEKELDRSYRFIDSSKSTSRFMFELYANLQRGEGLAAATGHQSGPAESIRAATIRCYSSAAKIRSKSMKGLYEYRVPRLPRSETLQLAEFRIPRKGVSYHPKKLKVSILRGQSSIETSVLRVKPFTSTDNNYLVYDITRSMRVWMNGYHGNMTVRIQVRRVNSAPESIGSTLAGGSIVGNPDSQQDGLLVFYSENKGFLETVYTSYTEQDVGNPGREKNRRHRSLRDSSSKRRKNKRNKGKGSSKKWRKSGKPCQKYDFEVDFDLIGWGSWIIFPKKFNSFLCHGACPSPINAKLHPTNHAMMQSLMREKRPKIAPMPCCSPSKLKPLSMLYYEHDEIVLRHHEDMIAGECGCQ